MKVGVTLVATRAGAVRGVDLGDVLVWQGIPYAAPPVGELRLRPPQPAVPWQGVREATAPGNAAMQSVLPGLPAPVMDEDCLYANVAAPPPDGRLRPVLVWVHGGGYLTGSGVDMYGDGRLFARTHDLVVVSFNYRLGSLGFLDIGDSSGVSGLLDQIQALRWVRENIAAFGGDPKRVTLYGLSAGAKSVANLLATPLTRGLIHRAASSSGGGDHVATPAQAKAVTVRFLRELGVSADRVREVPAAEMLAAQDAIATGAKALWIWRPVIDGTVLSGRPIDAIAAGAAAGSRCSRRPAGTRAAPSKCWTAVRPRRRRGCWPNCSARSRRTRCWPPTARADPSSTTPRSAWPSWLTNGTASPRPGWPKRRRDMRRCGDPATTVPFRGYPP